MFQRIKKFIIVLVIGFLLISIPMYAVARVVLPKILLDKVKESLPANSVLEIEEMKTYADLSVKFVGIKYSDLTREVVASELKIEPVLNLASPLRIKTELLTIQGKDYQIEATGVTSDVKLSSTDLSSLMLRGEFKEITNLDRSFLSNGNFLISGMLSDSLSINIESDSVNIVFETPKGEGKINLNNAKIYVDKADHIVVNVVSEAVQLSLDQIKPIGSLPNVSSSNLILNVTVGNEVDRLVPFELDLNVLKSDRNMIANTLKLSSVARWRFSKKECTLNQFILGADNCGRLVDFLDSKLLISDNVGKIYVSGFGLCVTPLAGCPQRIDVGIESLNTNHIFTKLFGSGILNPVLGGVLMGSLLNSTEKAASGYDQKIKFSVIGSELKINGKPILR